MSLIDTLKNEWLIDDDLLPTVLRMLANTLPSPTDSRDHSHYDKEPKVTERNWGRYVGNIENQGTIPMCVAQGCEVVARVHTNAARGVDMNTPDKLADFNSKAFYDLLKRNDGYPMVAGTDPRMGVKYLQKEGMVENRPNSGEVYKIDEYWRCKNLKETINDLLTIGPSTVCIRVFPSFYECNGIVKRPKSREKQEGLHQLCFTRRLDGACGGVNSWGTGFGDFGYFILPDELYDTFVTEVWGCK